MATDAKGARQFSSLRIWLLRCHTILRRLPGVETCRNDIQQNHCKFQAWNDSFRVCLKWHCDDWIDLSLTKDFWSKQKAIKYVAIWYCSRVSHDFTPRLAQLTTNPAVKDEATTFALPCPWSIHSANAILAKWHAPNTYIVTGCNHCKRARQEQGYEGNSEWPLPQTFHRSLWTDHRSPPTKNWNCQWVRCTSTKITRILETRWTQPRSLT